MTVGIFKLLAACLACLALVPVAALADATPAILSATVDYGGNRVTITGTNFSPDGAAPAVAIDSAALTLVSYTNETAAATLPESWESGAYVLAVTNGSHQTGVYNMTLSAPLGKLRYHARALYGPWALAGTAAYAGILQDLDTPREWGEGANGYGRRVASTEGAAVIHTFLAFGLDSTLHQDPRYFHSTRTGVFRRMADAARGTFLTRTDSGAETLSTWRLGSAYGAAIISNLWYPDRLDTIRLGFLQGTVRVGFDLITNLSSEFWPDVKKKLFRRN